MALLLHGAVLAAALLWPRPRAEPEAPPLPPPIVIFKESRQARPPAPPLQRGQESGAVPKRLPRARMAAPTVAQRAPPPEAQPEARPALDEPDTRGDPAGPADGDPHGVPGGIPGGVPGGVPGGEQIGEGTEPARVALDASSLSIQLVHAGLPIEYPAQAVEHEVEGTMLVRCLLTFEGTVRECRVLQSLPFMDGVVIRALESRRYLPVRLGGRPVEVDYTFRIQLTLPR